MRNVRNPSGLSQQPGQGMTEYLIIVALIAIAAIGAYSFFSQTARQQPAGATQEVPSKSAAKDGARTQSAAGPAAAPAGAASPAGDSRNAGNAK